MNPEEISLLHRTYEIAEENNKILKSMRRSARISTALRVFYWAVIILGSLGAYIALQPYLDQLKDIYGSAQDGLSNVKNLTNKINGLGL